MSSTRQIQIAKPKPRRPLAKFVCADNAMKVTTDATRETSRSSGFLREVKVTQIFEGTNQIQRMVIGRHLDRSCAGDLTVAAR